MTTNDQKAVATTSRSATLRDYLLSEKRSLAKRLDGIAAHGLRGDRLIRIALQAVSRNPELLECTPTSVATSLMMCAQLGLEPNLMNSVHLVPFYNSKIGAKECTMIPGYRGLVELAMRSGLIARVAAYVVLEGDEFEFELGTNERVIYRPRNTDDVPDKRETVAAWGYWQPVNGLPIYKMLTLSKLEAVRLRAPGSKSSKSPWNTSIEDRREMQAKTMLRQLLKSAPMSTEVAMVLDHENAVEVGRSSVLADEAAAALEAPPCEDPASAVAGKSDSDATPSVSTAGEPSGSDDPSLL